MDLWDINSGNRIIATDDPALLRTVLRELLAMGWVADDLNLGLPDERVLSGDALLGWLDNPV